jgi:hypothetical protein
MKPEPADQRESRVILRSHIADTLSVPRHNRRASRPDQAGDGSPMPHRTLLIAWIATALAGAALAAPAHEHGVARLDIAVDPGRVTLDLDSPLDNLLGFEHAPRNDAESAKVKAALARLRAAEALFHIDAGAGCKLAGVDLVSAPLQLGPPGPALAPAREDHGDLEGHFEFHCKQGTRAGFVEVGLFEAFPALQRIELQVATPKGQLKATLRRPASRVVLVR